MRYPMVDEDTLRINSPFGFLTSTADKALKTYMSMKEGHRKAETDIAKAILEGLIKRDDTQMRSDLPQGMDFQDPSQIAGMFEPRPKTPSFNDQIDAQRFSEDYGYDPFTGKTKTPSSVGNKPRATAQDDRRLDLTSRGLDLEEMRIKLEKARLNKADKEKEPTFFDFHKLADEKARSIIENKMLSDEEQDKMEKLDAENKGITYVPKYRERENRETYEGAYKNALGSYQALHWLSKNKAPITDANIKAVRQKFGW